MRAILTFGARPNYMKIAPLYRAMRRSDQIRPILVNTGQHFDREMSEVFVDQLGLPAPDVDLSVGAGTQAQQIARVIERLEPVLEAERPDVVVVVGDVSSTLAASVCAATKDIPIAHVEAGLRSRDWRMPEERNRVLTDRLSRFLLTPSEDADANLRDEGIDPDRIHFVGNVMIDTLDSVRQRLDPGSTRAALGVPEEFVLVTVHRPSNVDDRSPLREIASALTAIADEIDVAFPMHPRTRRRLEEFGIAIDHPRIHVLPPLGYVEFASLMLAARAIVTDSGGIQEESCVLGVPCLILRENTERPVTLQYGHNRLVRSRADEILRELGRALRVERAHRSRPPLWDGNTADRIVRVLADGLAPDRADSDTQVHRTPTVVTKTADRAAEPTR